MTAEPVWRIDDRLRALRPEATGLLDRVNASAWSAVPADLLELVRLRVAALIGNGPGLVRRSGAARDMGLSEAKIQALDDYATSEEFTARERDCLHVAEQFVIDVSGMSTADLERVGQHFTTEDLAEFVRALYATECTQRLEVMSDLLLDPPGDDALIGAEARAVATADATVQQALRDYQDAVVRGNDIDMVLTELVRLRCARTHDCRICQTLRLSEARLQGADDVMTAKVDFYESSDLDERTKTALRVTDAFITRPDTLTVAATGQARTIFTPAELAELFLDITKWSTQKIHVALGTDSAEALPVDESGVSYFRFDEDGRVAGYSVRADSR